MKERKVTPEMIAKLPKWAQKHIERLERDRDVAETNLVQFMEAQKPTPFYAEEYLNLGEYGGWSFQKRYFQEVHRMCVEWGGVRLSILLRDERGHTGRDEIELQYDDLNRSENDIVMQPKSFQQIAIFSVSQTRQARLEARKKESNE